MSSNSSSPIEEKNFLTEDSAGVPVLAVTAELPVDVEGRSEAHGGGGTPSAAQGGEASSAGIERSDGPGAEPGATETGATDVGRALATIAALEQTNLDETGMAARSDQSETMPSPFEAPFEPSFQPLSETPSDEQEAVILESSRLNSASEDSSPDVLTSAVLPLLAQGESAPVEISDELDGDMATAMDATDLVIDGEESAPDDEPPTPGPQLGAADEDFLRRVVLPPLPRDARPTGERAAVGALGSAGALDDHTVISEPPSPELLASLAVPPIAPAAAPLAAPQSSGMVARRRGGVRLSYLQFGGLMLLAIGVGTILPSRLRPHLPPQLASVWLGSPGAPTALSSPPVAPERAAVVPAAPVVVAASAAPEPVAPPPAAPAAKKATPSDEAMAAAPTKAVVAAAPTGATSAAKAAGEPTARSATKAASAKGTPAKRGKRIKRAAKKAFVDPFE